MNPKLHTHGLDRSKDLVIQIPFELLWHPPGKIQEPDQTDVIQVKSFDQCLLLEFGATNSWSKVREKKHICFQTSVDMKVRKFWCLPRLTVLVAGQSSWSKHTVYRTLQMREIMPPSTRHLHSSNVYSIMTNVYACTGCPGAKGITLMQMTALLRLWRSPKLCFNCHLSRWFIITSFNWIGKTSVLHKALGLGSILYLASK